MEKTFQRLKNPRARRAYVEAELITGLAHQIRVLRLQRGWKQDELAKKLGTTQGVVSRLEDPSYGRASLKTLLQLSTAFDVALQVRFVSLTHYLQDNWKISREALEVEPFEQEAESVGFYTDSPTHYVAMSNSPQLGLQSPAHVVDSKLFTAVHALLGKVLLTPVSGSTSQFLSSTALPAKAQEVRAVINASE